MTTPQVIDERKQIETRGHEVRTFQLERAKIETAPISIVISAITFPRTGRSMKYFESIGIPLPLACYRAGKGSIVAVLGATT